MKPIWKKSMSSDSEGNHELWLGVPSWDKENERGELSIKFAYQKGGRVPRTAPEVPENIVMEMVVMLAEHGRLGPDDLGKLQGLLNQPRRSKLPPFPSMPQPGNNCSGCNEEFTRDNIPNWTGVSGWLCTKCASKLPPQPFPGG